MILSRAWALALFNELKQLMKPEEVGSWLLTEMEEFENRTPADLISKGETGRLWASLFYLRSGMPDLILFEPTAYSATARNLQDKNHGDRRGFSGWKDSQCLENGSDASDSLVIFRINQCYYNSARYANIIDRPRRRSSKN